MIKELAKQIKEYKKYVILSPIFVALESVMEIIIPFLMSFTFIIYILLSLVKNKDYPYFYYTILLNKLDGRKDIIFALYVV